jgi:hypothetical protein
MTVEANEQAGGKGRFGNPVLYILAGILILGVVALFAWPKDNGPMVNQSSAATSADMDVTANEQAAVTAQSIPSGTFVNWSAEGYPEPVTFKSGEVSVTVTAQEEEGLVLPQVRVNAPGMREHVLIGQALERTGAHRIGIGRLNPQARIDHVILASYSGGAHCCTSIQVAVPSGDGFVTADLGQWDGDGIGDFPKDISGDGVADFILRDNAFLYTFSSYADSMAPPEIQNLVGTKFVDVSKAPAFRKLFADFAARAQQACISPEDGAQPNGACAGYVAAAARLGQFESAWSEMLNAYDADFDWGLPPGCKVKAMPCPDGQEIEYPDYPTSLYHFLIRTGYIAPGTPRPATPNADDSAFEMEEGAPAE